MNDFQIACVRKNDKDAILSYMKNAYVNFFDNEYESIDAQEIIDLFCQEKDINKDLIKEIMKQIDDDDSNTISADEFYGKMCALLKFEDTADFGICSLIEKLKWPRDADGNILVKQALPINQSGTFIGYTFDEKKMKVTKNEEAALSSANNE